MGRKRHLLRRPPPEGTSPVGFAKWLGYSGEILVLFETPSGFALFNYDGTQLFRPKAIENIWAYFARDYMAKDVVMLREFQTFEDKASAIKPETGVSDQLARMIKKWLRPGQKLAVGKRGYKTTIEASLVSVNFSCLHAYVEEDCASFCCEFLQRIYCLFDNAVAELMWGLKNLMKSLVPGEKLELTKEDCLPMSKGMTMVLERYACDLKPEMVNSSFIETAQALYECDLCVNKHAGSLQITADVLKEASGIDCKDWDPLKLLTAVKIICYPKEKYKSEMFSDDVRSKLEAVAPSLEGKFFVNTCLEMYEEMTWAYEVWDEAQRMLSSLVKEARESYTAEAEQTDLPEKTSGSVLSSLNGSDLTTSEPDAV